MQYEPPSLNMLAVPEAASSVENPFRPEESSQVGYISADLIERSLKHGSTLIDESNAIAVQNNNQISNNIIENGKASSNSNNNNNNNNNNRSSSSSSSSSSNVGMSTGVEYSSDSYHPGGRSERVENDEDLFNDDEALIQNLIQDQSSRSSVATKKRKSGSIFFAKGTDGNDGERSEEENKQTNKTKQKKPRSPSNSQNS